VINKIKDKVFGEMEYKHSWTKQDSFIFLGKPFMVNVVAQAYKDDDILEFQQKNYMNFRNYLEEHKDDIQKILEDYCKTTYNITIKLSQCLEPKTIIFERDDSWGILFDTKYDIENGIALFVIDNEIKVGTQDLFL
jgi:hypothetical protein